MKNSFLKSAIILFCSFSTINITAQVNAIRTMSLAVSDHKAQCGTTAEAMLHFHNEQIIEAQKRAASSTAAQLNFPSNLIETCGAFKIYYGDYLRPVPEGFADPSVGASRRNTFCAVLNYIQSIIKIPASTTIDLWIADSYSTSYPAPAGATFLANATPYFPASYGQAPGVYAGHMYNHIISGIDPDAANYDARIQVNFDATLLGGIQYWDDHNDLSNNCAYDLYSVLLHEVTHAMGWFSNIGEDNTSSNFNPVCKVSNRGFSLMDYKYFYYGDVKTPSSFSGNKLVTGTITNPSLNVAINTYSTPLRTNAIWMNNMPAPKNHPVYSGEGFAWYPVNSASLMSHLNYNTWSFYSMAQFSPGFQPKYVMAASFAQEELRRNWTLFEIRTLLDMGYSLNPVFASSTSINGTDLNSTLLFNNIPAYRSNTSVPILGPLFISHEQTTEDYTLVNNNTPSNFNQSVLTISLSTGQSNLNIADNNNDPVKVMPGSLFGIMGVSNGSNNHALLTLNAQGTVITFTPSPGYIGKAQFAFYLWDGHEQGALKMVTINVKPGSYNVVPGNELVINGGFEDGSEVKMLTSGTTSYSSLYDGVYEGEINAGRLMAGAHPYSFLGNLWAPLGGGIIVNKSANDCNDAMVGQIGSFTNSSSGPTAFPNTLYLPPPPNTVANNNRTARIGYSPGYCFSTLINPVKPCSTYVFECDFGFPRYGFFSTHSLGEQFNFKLEFTTDPANNPDSVTVLQSIPITLTVTAIAGNPNADWQHYSTKINYCGSLPSRFFRLNTTIEDVFIDNMSLKQSTPNPLTVQIFPTQPSTCPGISTQLSATANNNICSVSYTWQPGNIHTASIVVSPSVTTIYSLTVADCYRTYTTTVPVTVGIPDGKPVELKSKTGTTLCNGDEFKLIATSTGAPSYTWASSPATPLTPTVTSGELSGTLNTTTTFTATGTANNGCKSRAVITITVLPLPAVVLTSSPTAVCAGNTATLTAGGATTYTWTSTPTTAITQNSTGNSKTTNTLTTASTFTVRGTAANGCTAQAVKTVSINTDCQPVNNCSVVTCTDGYIVAFRYRAPLAVTTTSVDVQNISMYMHGQPILPIGVFSPPCPPAYPTHTVSYVWTLVKTAGTGAPLTIAANITTTNFSLTNLTPGLYDLTLKMIIQQNVNGVVYTCTLSHTSDFGIGTGYYFYPLPKTPSGGQTTLPHGKTFTWNLYPNPASDHVVINWENLTDEQVEEISVYDVNGKQTEAFLVKTGKQEYVIQTQQYLNGTYLIKIRTNTGGYYQKIVIINK